MTGNDAPMTPKEFNNSVTAYYWLRRVRNAGFVPSEPRVFEALQARFPNLNARALRRRFREISSLLEPADQLQGFPPEKPDEDTAAKLRAAIDFNRTPRQVLWMVDALPIESVRSAVSQLVEGKEFDYADSTGYDVITTGENLPPKKVIGLAGLIHFGAPLGPYDFSGGEASACFRKLKAADLEIVEKWHDPESDEFRDAVSKEKRGGSNPKPKGNERPQRRIQQSTVFQRDSRIVACVEKRAKGHCEKCGEAAPFLRPNDEPFFEVHHIIPLSEGGPDTVENAVALCPNCHRECHHGKEAGQIREQLKQLGLK